MTTLPITARRWEGKHEGGWELLNGDYALTQVRRLSDARQQVVDYLDTIEPGECPTDWGIRIMSAT